MPRKLYDGSRTMTPEIKASLHSFDDADDIVAMEYQKLLAEPQEEIKSYQTASVLYPGDQIYFKSKYRPTYQVNIYEKFQHTWEFENTGIQVWRGRRLFFSNHDAVCLRAEAVYIDIPDTPPHKSVKNNREHGCPLL